MKRISAKSSSSIVSIFTLAFCLSNSLLLPSQSANAQELIRQNNDSQLVAITVPNFRPNTTYSNGTLEVSIPQALLAGAIDQILRTNEGRVKDTEFQRVDISNMRFSLVQERFDSCGNRSNCVPSGQERTESGFRVEGQWQFQFRERLARNPFSGNWTHTSWTSVSGTFSQPLYFRVNNSRLDLQPGGLTLRGDRWYADAVAPIANLFGVQGQIKENLRSAVQDINGMDLRQILIEYGSQQAANQLGVNREAVNRLISQNVRNIGARVSGSNLIISVALPQSDFRQSVVRLRGVAHVQDVGDISFQGGEFVGSRGQSRRLEGFLIEIVDQVPGLGIQYMAHLQSIGDTPWSNGGQFVGTRGQSRRLEGFAIQLTGSEAANYNVFYKCHVQNVGDTQVLANGQFCGTRGQSLRVEGLQVWIERR